MSAGSAIYLGKTGATGGVTGPHGHFEVIKDGKRYGLSQARADLGQKIQFRLPGSQEWQQMYSPQAGGQFKLNPALSLTEGMGTRAVHPVTGAKNVPHLGEDYPFPANTDLRFMGGGTVQGIANVGRAGNISSLQTGPYKLDVFHMNKLPGAASAPESMQAPAAPVLPGAPQGYDQASQRTQDLLEAFMYGTQYREAKKPKSFLDTMREQVTQSMLNQALNPGAGLGTPTGLPEEYTKAIWG